MKTITSLSNETVKQTRALHMRKAREESGLFLAEGLRSVAEAVELGYMPRLILHSAAAGGQSLLAKVASAARDVLVVTPAILEKVSRRDNPQAVLGVFEQRWAALRDFERTTRPVIGLERVRDPGNLGAIVRTADAAGAAGVILIGDCCDPWSVEAVRATMGSIFAVRIAHASEDAFLAWRADWPGEVVGASLDASIGYRELDYRPPALILMGNEQSGLTQRMASACDATVRIPMRGRADSLNLAVATGLMVYAFTGDD